MREEAKVCSTKKNKAKVIITCHSACDNCDKNCGLSWFILPKIDNYYKNKTRFQPEIIKINSDSDRYSL